MTKQCERCKQKPVAKIKGHEALFCQECIDELEAEMAAPKPFDQQELDDFLARIKRNAEASSR